MIPSSSEIAREKHAQALEQRERDRLARFEKGLKDLKSLDIDRSAEDKPRTAYEREYRGACHTELRRIMTDAEAARKAQEAEATD